MTTNKVHIGGADIHGHFQLCDWQSEWVCQQALFHNLDDPRLEICYYKHLLDSGHNWFYVLGYEHPQKLNPYLKPKVLPEDVLDAILKGKCTLLMCNYAESHFTDIDLHHTHEMFDILKKDFGIPEHQLRWITNTIGGGQAYLNFCVRNHLSPARVKHISFMEFMIPDSEQWHTLNIPKRRFMFLEKGGRPHRMILANWMFKYQIDVLMSFNLNSDTQEFLYISRDKYPELDITDTDIDDFYKTLPHNIDNVDLNQNNIEEHLSAVGNNKMVIANQRSGIHIVGETNFEEPGKFYTEKIMKPIMNQKPFIILGQHGMCEHLKVMGFKTFHPFIDETYDTITDPMLRLKAICSEIQRLNNLTDTDFHSMLAEVQGICEHNFNHIKDFGKQTIELDEL